MFAITKLTPTTQSYVTALSVSEARSKVTSIALARALTRCLDLPTGAIGNAADIMSFYTTHGLEDVKSKLAGINELVMVNIDEVLTYCEKFYLTRYYLAFPVASVLAFRKDFTTEDFFGINKQFDDETLNLIRCCGADVAVRYNRFSTILDELFPCATQSQTV